MISKHRISDWTQRNKTTTLFLVRLLRLAISLIILSYTAKFFGVSIKRDIWLLSATFIVALDNAVWGPINETFRTKFIEKVEITGREHAIRDTQSLLKFMGTCTFILCIIIELFPELFVKIISPAVQGKDLDEMVKILRVIAPSLFINQVTQFFTNLLNTFNVFYLPEIAGFISSLSSIFIIIWGVEIWGIYVLAISHYFYLLLLSVLLYRQITKLKISFFNWDIKFSIKSIIPYIKFALPLYIPYFLGQANIVIEKNLSNHLGIGVVSTIEYSKRFGDVLYTVLFSVLMTIMVPHISRHFMKKNINDFKAELGYNLHIGILILGGLTGFWLFSGKEIVEFFFNNGTIPATNLKLIFELGFLYIIGFLMNYFYNVFGLALMCTLHGKIYSFMGILASVLIVLINVGLYSILKIFVFPTSIIISYIIVAILMELKLRRVFGQGNYGITKYISLVLVLCTVLYFINKLLSINIHFSALIIIFIKGILFVAVSVALLYIGKIKETYPVLQFIKKALVRRKTEGL